MSRTKSLAFCLHKNYNEPPYFCECHSHFWSPDWTSENHFYLFPISAHLTSPVNPISKMALCVIFLSSGSPYFLLKCPPFHLQPKLRLQINFAKPCGSDLLTNSFNKYLLNMYYHCSKYWGYFHDANIYNFHWPPNISGIFGLALKVITEVDQTCLSILIHVLPWISQPSYS